MKVRHIGKFTIAVGNASYDGMVGSMNNLVSVLNELGVKYKLLAKRRLIITKQTIIKFIYKKEYSYYHRNIYGVKCNGCYGFSKEEAYNITEGHNQCEGYELVDYILERENGGT